MFNIFLSIYMIGLLITLGGAILYNAAFEDMGDTLPLWKAAWLSAIWPITWTAIFYQIYRVHRDGS